MDALSDVLTAVRLTGAVYFDVNTTAPWVAETPPGREIVGRIFPRSDHLMAYHVVTTGRAWAMLDGAPALRLDAGDVIVFPQGDAHALASAPGMRGNSDLSSYRTEPGQSRPFSIALGDSGGERARVVCGFLGCDTRPFNPLLDALPRVIHVHGGPDSALAAFATFAARESAAQAAGSDCVLGRLSEMLFVDVIRKHLETLSAADSGWLAALRDPAVSRALSVLHRDPARPWSLDGLSREAGLSRSALAERFTQLVGHPPMQYLTRWRMQLAARGLREADETVASIAARVGYESEAAFSRAFKKATGSAPGTWRTVHRGQTR